MLLAANTYSCQLQNTPLPSYGLYRFFGRKGGGEGGGVLLGSDAGQRERCSSIYITSPQLMYVVCIYVLKYTVFGKNMQ